MSDPEKFKVVDFKLYFICFIVDLPLLQIFEFLKVVFYLTYFLQGFRFFSLQLSILFHNSFHWLFLLFKHCFQIQRNLLILFMAFFHLFKLRLIIYHYVLKLFSDFLQRIVEFFVDFFQLETFVVIKWYLIFKSENGFLFLLLPVFHILQLFGQTLYLDVKFNNPKRCILVRICYHFMFAY